MAAGNHRYVIVGAGSAGCVLANRLSADPACLVGELLEAGGPDRKREIRIPAALTKLFLTEYDWNYRTTKQPHLSDREVYWPRGRTAAPRRPPTRPWADLGGRTPATGEPRRDQPCQWRPRGAPPWRPIRARSMTRRWPRSSGTTPRPHTTRSAPAACAATMPQWWTAAPSTRPGRSTRRGRVGDATDHPRPHPRSHRHDRRTRRRPHPSQQPQAQAKPSKERLTPKASRPHGLSYADAPARVTAPPLTRGGWPTTAPRREQRRDRPGHGLLPRTRRRRHGSETRPSPYPYTLPPAASPAGSTGSRSTSPTTTTTSSNPRNASASRR